MSRKIVVHATEGGWEPSKVPGVQFRPLNVDERNAGTYLVKMDPGTLYPAHNHPEGEEVFVVCGSVRVGADRLEPGDYLYTPPGASHDAHSEAGCTFLVVLPGPVQFLK